MIKKIKWYVLLIILCMFSTVIKVNATTVYIDENTSKSDIDSWLSMETYDTIILNGDKKLYSCPSYNFIINPSKDKPKTIDLNGHKLELGPSYCSIELSGLTRGGVINIIDSSEEKTGVFGNKLFIRNCRSKNSVEDCSDLEININGGTYTADTFLKFTVPDSTYIGTNYETYYAKNIKLNISNIKFTGELFFENYSNNIGFRNSLLIPKKNMIFTDYEPKLLLSDIIPKGSKVLHKYEFVPLNTNVSKMDLEESNLYVVKDTDIVNISNFETKNLNYDIEKLKLKLTNPTDESIKIKSITIDNTDDFELYGTGDITLDANGSVETNYYVSTKAGLSVGIYKTNILLKDSDGNLYADTISFEVENIPIDKPQVDSELLFDYDGTEHEVTFSGFDTNTMEIKENKATEVGIYSATISLKEGYCWRDGTTDDIIYNWTIRRVDEIENIKILGSNFLNVDKTLLLKAVIFPTDATYKDVTWSVENGTGQATIDQDGVLTPTKVGTVKVKATANYNNSIFTEKDIVINSKGSLERIMITAPSYYLSVKSSYQLSSNIYPTNIDNVKVNWTSLDTEVATIDQNGLLTPIKEGNVTVRATANDDSNVFEDIEFYIYDPDITILGNVGDTLSTTFESSVKCTNYKITYSNTSIFKQYGGSGYNFVSEPYKYYIHSLVPQMAGYSKADLMCNSTILGTRDIYVYNSINNISSEYSEIILEKDEIFTLDIPSWYEDKSSESNGVYFTIEDSSIATIDYNGRIKGLKNGNTNVIAFSKYNEQKIVIPLSVVDDKNNYKILSESISITGETTDLRVGKQFQYQAIITPTNTTNKDVAWSVENGTGQATIDQNGLLTALSAGSVVVKVATKDGTNLIGTLNVTLKDYVDVENIFLKTKSIYIDMGKSLYMDAIIFPENATIKKVKWSSSDTSIATIDPDTGGLATNYKKGDVTITATATDGTGVVGTILLHVGYTNVKVGEIVSVSNSSYVTYEDVIWSISDENILGQTGEKGYTSINNKYYRHYIKVKGLKNGNTNVVMKTISGSELASSIVYVYTPISSLSSDLKEIRLSKSETKKLNIIIAPSDVTSGLDSLIYTSSDSTIVKVDQDGNVTGIKNGQANIVIYSQYDNISLTIPVTVDTYSESLTLDVDTLNLNNDIKEHQIQYKVLPEEAVNKNVIFSSEDTSVATVSESGLITAVRSGSTKIIVKTEDGRQTKEIKVTVTGMEKDINSIKYENINSVIYNGLEQTPEINLLDGNYKLIKDVDFTVVYEKNINAGTAVAIIKGIGNFKGTKSVNFVIDKADIEYSSTGTTTIYDGEEYGIDLNVATPNVKIMYADNDGNYTLSSMPKYKNAGTYSVKFQLSVDDNYKIILGSSSVIIQKAPLEVEYSSYDNTQTYDGKEYGIDLNVTTPNVKIMYADSNGNYTLSSMPRYKNAGTYSIKFQLSIDDNHTTINGANILKINKGNYKNNTKDKYVYYDGNDYSIDLDIDTDEYSARYSVGNDFSYSLPTLPKFREVGQYKINYRLSADNFNDYTHQSLLTIYGISSFDSTLKLNKNILSIRDYNNRFSSLYTKIKLLANTSDWKHLDVSKKEINNEIIKTGDYVQLVINEEKTYQYQLSVLGDVNGDGKISALDYVKIKNHIMKTSLIDNNVNLLSADLNEDGKISALDYVRVKNYIMNGGK